MVVPLSHVLSARLLEKGMLETKFKHKKIHQSINESI